MTSSDLPKLWWTTLSKIANFVLSKRFFQRLELVEFFQIFFFCEEYLIRTPTFIVEIFWKLWFLKYRTRAIITRSWFETSLDYIPRLLGPKIEEFTFLVHKLSVILTALQSKPQMSASICISKLIKWILKKRHRDFFLHIFSIHSSSRHRESNV